MSIPLGGEHMVNPEPALNFAGFLGVPAAELDSDCGRLSPACEQAE